MIGNRTSRHIGLVGSRVALGLALALGVSSHSWAQNKGGTYKGTYTAFGKFKAMPVGPDRILTIYSDEIGQGISDGFLDHVVWQCWGTGDFTKGVGHEQGQCIATDPAGDQVVDNWVTEDHELGSKSVKVIDKYTGGTGKYARISGGGTAVLDAGFRAPEGTYAVHGPTEGNYTIALAQQTGGTADEAKAMLMKAVAAVKADKAKALDVFNKGEGGFLDKDLYVFCGNVSDGKAVAIGNPNAKQLIGVDTRTLKDATGKSFGAELYAGYQKPEGEITEVTYMFPRPGADKTPVPKVSLVTRVSDDLGCGVGYYK